VKNHVNEYFSNTVLTYQGQAMSKESEYEQRIAQYNREGLLNFWKAIEMGDTPGWESGRALEYLILRAFQLEGIEIRWPYKVTIAGEEVEQIDGFLYTDSMFFLVECKDQAEKTRIEPIAKLRNQLLRRPVGTIGVVFSRSGFTEPAVTLAQFLAPQTILLWDGEEISYAVQLGTMRDTLIAKYRYCVENGLSDYFMRK
jgi:hypothetical protein